MCGLDDAAQRLSARVAEAERWLEELESELDVQPD